MKTMLKGLKVGLASFGIALGLLMLTFIPIDHVMSQYFGEPEALSPAIIGYLFWGYFLVSLPISAKYLR